MRPAKSSPRTTSASRKRPRERCLVPRPPFPSLIRADAAVLSKLTASPDLSVVGPIRASLYGGAFSLQAVLDAREEFLCVNRLRYVRVHARLQAAVAVTIDGVRCKSDNRRASRAGLFS